LLQPDTKIYRLVYNPAIVPDLKYDSVHPYNQIDRIQRAILPS
jgi:hypothetical protein